MYIVTGQITAAFNLPGTKVRQSDTKCLKCLIVEVQEYVFMFLCTLSMNTEHVHMNT